MARSAGFRSKKPYEVWKLVDFIHSKGWRNRQRKTNIVVFNPIQRSAGPRGSDGMWVHDLHDKNVPPAVVNANRKPQSEDSANNKLLVSNLHYEVTENDLIVCISPITTQRSRVLYEILNVISFSRQFLVKLVRLYVNPSSKYGLLRFSAFEHVPKTFWIDCFSFPLSLSIRLFDFIVR